MAVLSASMDFVDFEVFSAEVPLIKIGDVRHGFREDGQTFLVIEDIEGDFFEIAERQIVSVNESMFVILAK